MAKQYIRTDKNGTKIYHDYTCPRCGGRGGSDSWIYTGWTCYECGGRGETEKPREIKEYTAEFRAILDARAAKRREKKMAQAQAEKAEKQAAWKQEKGFQDDRIYLVGIADSFEKQDEIKAAGGRYNEFTGWYFSEHHPEYQTVEMTAEELLGEDAWGKLNWVAAWEIREKMKKKLPQEPASEHIGQVGDKVDLEVTYTRTGSFQTAFGTTWVHNFKDAAGNILIWKTSACSGFEKDTLRIKATIKAHDEYNGVKQTVLTRCKIA